MRNKTSFAQNLSLIIFGLFLTIIILEIGLHLGEIVFLSLQKYRNILSIRQKGEYRIMCLGESTTALGGRYSYPSQLERILNQADMGIKFTVINCGRPAATTTSLLNDLLGLLNEYKPDMVIAMMGVNDINRNPLYNDTSYIKNKRFLQRFKAYNLLKAVYFQTVVKIREKGMSKIKERSTVLETNSIFLEKQSFSDKIMQPPTLNAKVDSSSDSACVELGLFYMRQGKLDLAEQAFRKPLQSNPGNDSAMVGLGLFYAYTLRKMSQAFELFHRAIEVNPKCDWAYIELGLLYMDNCDFIQAESMFKKAIEIRPNNSKALSNLAVLYAAEGKHYLAQEYFSKATEANSDYCVPIVQVNYQKLKAILDKRNIRLVCMQYPMRSIKPLKKIFQDESSVIFVDNEYNFRGALNDGNYKQYFTDMFGIDFGHCTLKGNKLLAENTANIILKKMFNK